MSSPLVFEASAPSAASGQGPPTSLERAYLELLHPPSTGIGKPGRSYDTISFQFNPNELAFTKAARWRRSPQRNTRRSGVPQFQGPDPCKLTLEMFFDATDTMDDKVVKARGQAVRCCVPTDKTLASRSRRRPPWVVFHWGVLTGFPAFVSKCQRQVHAVHPGRPADPGGCARSTMEEIAGVPPGQNPTSGALAARESTCWWPATRWRRRLPGVRRPGPLAGDRRGERHRRPDAAAAGHPAAGARARGADRWPTEQFASGLAGGGRAAARCRRRSRRCCVAAMSTTAGTCPTVFVLRFRDPAAWRWARAASRSARRSG